MPAPHKMTQVIRGLHVITCSQRGVAVHAFNDLADLRLVLKSYREQYALSRATNATLSEATVPEGVDVGRGVGVAVGAGVGVDVGVAVGPGVGEQFRAPRDARRLQDRCIVLRLSLAAAVLAILDLQLDDHSGVTLGFFTASLFVTRADDSVQNCFLCLRHP